MTNFSDIRDVLLLSADYFDERADADQPSGHSPIPNEEMTLLCMINDILLKRFNLMYKPSSSSEKQVCPACRGNGFVRDEEGVGDCMVCDSTGEVLESFNLKTGD